MYTVTNKLKIFAIVLMVLGAALTAVGFASTPASEQAVQEMIDKNEMEHGGDSAAHATSGHDAHDSTAAHGETAEHHGPPTSDTSAYAVYHQLKNRPWSAVYVSAFFFFMIGLGALAFNALQKVSQAGWSPVLFRVMEGISSYILPGGIIMFVLLLLSAFHVNHLFHWMDPRVIDPNDSYYDPIIAGKSGYLDISFFLFRAGAFLVGWNWYRINLRKFSLNQDAEPDGNVWYKKAFKHSAAFLVFFMVTESIMSWDWIMSFDPHWFSTLFGWYVFSSMFVTGVTTIALVTIYLKSQGYLEFVNDSHIHDLAKFMFGLSIFWTYLWFCRFMLIWYSNIPEEVTYFIARIEDYNILFFGMVAINFLFPLLILMNSDFKRVNWFVVTAGLFIVLGHYLDIFVMVMPATVGKSWFIGFPEIGAFLFFAGLFIYVVFNTISKAPLLAKGDPFMGESKHFHY